MYRKGFAVLFVNFITFWAILKETYLQNQMVEAAGIPGYGTTFLPTGEPKFNNILFKVHIDIGMKNRLSE